MPINISTIPKKTTKSTKKKEESTRTCKGHANGPDPNAPQPPSSPESDATDNEVENELLGINANGNGNGNDATTEVKPPKSTKKDTATAAALSKAATKSSSSASYDRLEVNRLLSDIFPSKYMSEKVNALEASASSATRTLTRTRVKPITTNAVIEPMSEQTQTRDDPIAQAIIASAFAELSQTQPQTQQPPPQTQQTNPLSLSTPPATPKSGLPNASLPNASLPNASLPNAPKKRTIQKRKNDKQKQNFNIIIHVEPESKSSNANAIVPTPNDISKRLDFGSSKRVDDDDSDDDYVPGCTDDDEWSDSYSNSDSSDNEYDDEYDDDECDDDDSYYSSSSSDDECDPAELETLQKKYTDEIEMMQSLRTTYEDMLVKDKTNRVVAKQLQTLKQSEDKIRKELDNLTHNQKRQNSKKFRKLLRKKNSTNDLEYFKNHLTIQAQRALIEEMNEVTKVTAIDKPYKLTLLESDIPRDMKAVAIRKVGMLQYMEPGCGEYCKLKNWVEAFMQIPFGKNKNLPLTISDGVDRCHEFMTSAKNRLDTAVYGLNDAKMQIMQMVGQWIANPAAIGTAVAIHGPPGTGKTSLVKEGISKILGRDFAFIALGGATDSSFLEGHSYTYEGSMWGKIVDILIRCKSSNPVIYFDELDKISDTSKGEEIVGILTHLTDTSQNSQFHDKYFSEVGFDLSKCLFIFSYNDESRVNPVLLDRMYKIRTTGYGTKDKTFIAQHHLIPRIRTEVAFAEGDIVIPDSVIEYIVEHCTHKEAGVRNLKRCLEIIHTKLNLYRLMRPGTQLFDDKDMSLEVSFPYNVTREVVDKLIKKGDADRPNINMYL
jgi:hypothetical protein